MSLRRHCATTPPAPHIERLGLQACRRVTELHECDSVGQGSQNFRTPLRGRADPAAREERPPREAGLGRVAAEPPKGAKPEPSPVPQLPKRQWPRPEHRAERRVDRIGNISFASAVYNVGRAFSGSAVEVFTRNAVVHIAIDGKIVKRHDAAHTPEQTLAH